MSQPAIVVENLGKRYKIGRPARPATSWRHALLRSLQAHLQRLRLLSEQGTDDDFIWALHDASFSVRPGEVVGVVGRNGSGKSTLLKILSRVVTPTTGHALINGRIASLLEVGTGFHPELTGRENIYLSGSILGMARAEIRARFDEIVAFSEIERFLDTPVKRYSSGMFVRLAFAVAAHLQPEILLIDEVLAVGDAAFQAKCLGTMDRVAKEGRTILFVSHNMAAITQICTRAILLEQGRAILDGPPDQAVNTYLRQLERTSGATEAAFEPQLEKPMQITAMRLRTSTGRPCTRLDARESCLLEIDYTVRRWRPGTYVCVAVTTQNGIHVLFATDVEDADQLSVPRRPGHYAAQIEVPADVLAPGRYTCSAAICAPGTGRPFDFREAALGLEITDNDSLLARIGVKFPALTRVSMKWRTQYVGRAPDTAPTSRDAGRPIAAASVAASD